ncbi:MAG: hypothetical protein JXR31_15685 [Prolixibacteraceae bacterium]|nr:hypothetical protein [Prolixibacteraceae bacterium]
MRIFAALILVLITFSCVKNKTIQSGTVMSEPIQNAPMGASAPSHIVEVKEVIQGNTYTYLLVTEHGLENWIAANKQEAEVGEKYAYADALQMTNFTSKEIDRTFDVIYFVSQLSDDQNVIASAAGTMAMAHSGNARSDQKEIKVNLPEGAVSIAELFKNRNNYSGKKVKVHGVVVKINKSIMGTNWIHIQDGTDHEGNYDLTITSQEEPNVDDEVTFEGTITLNKDFGAGYFYEVILENGEMTGSVI